MTPISLLSIDGEKVWFDSDAATSVPEGTIDVGKGPVSAATGSSSTHQMLFRTRLVSYVLRTWTDDGKVSDYEQIDSSTAAKWLAVNADQNAAKNITIGPDPATEI